MVKKKVKGSKQVQKAAEPWLTEDVRVHTALPPQVEGQLRCFCRLSINQIIWVTPVIPDVTLVRVKWWGEDGDGSTFKPVNVKKGDKAVSQTTARYPVRSGPRQFAAYLNDMAALTLEVMTGQVAAPIGIAEVPQIGLLSVNRPINGFFPVFSPSEEKLAELQVSVVLEPLMASYDSMGSIPTSDISMETQATQESTFPHRNQPQPHVMQPSKPQDDPFVSPASHQNIEIHQKEKMPYMSDVKQRLLYDLNDVHVKTTGQSHPFRDGSTVSITANGDVVTTTDTHPSVVSPQQSRYPPTASTKHAELKMKGDSLNSGAQTSGDVLSVLLQRGKKLRDAMAISTVDSRERGQVAAEVPDPRTVLRSSSSGILLKEILKAEKSAAEIVMSTDDLIAKDLNSKAVDLVVGSPVHKNEFKMLQLYGGGSPVGSVSSDAADLSEVGDPLQEESILQDLFYKHSESDASVLSENSGEEKEKSLMNSTIVSLEDPANVRPPSRQSSVSSLSLQFPEKEPKKKKRSTSKSRKNTSARGRPKVSKLQRSRSSSRSRSRTRTKSKSRTKASSGSEISDSEIPSTPRSEISRVSFDMTPSDVDEPLQDTYKHKPSDGLSVERLTLLGRVHIARVSVDCLTLHADPESSIVSNKSTKGIKKGKPPRPNVKPKRPCTYFIEYQFPVVATSRDKYCPNTMATEVMRVASKNIKNKVVTFNHRSVFPLMFDGNAIEKWWKSALVFKVFSREAGQKIPSPVGSCGVSLKSILKSEGLSIIKNLEVREACKNSSLNSSKLCGVFGHLKTTIELASDHREFASALAKTKLVEMSGKAKIVPIPTPPSPRRPHPLITHDQSESSTGVTNSVNSLPPPPFELHTKYTGLPDEPVPSLQLPSSNNVSQQTCVSTNITQMSSTRHLHQLQPTSTHSVSQNISGPEPLALHMLLMIPEGRNINLQGVPPLHMVNKRPMLLQQSASHSARDTATRNPYLVCRMFWCNDAVQSTVCWGTLQPQFNFLQVVPMLMSQALQERMRNNYLVVEVWDKKTAAGDDKLIGMVKLSLHQFYMSFRDQKVATALLKSQYPVIAADNYFGIMDPFTSFQYGQLRLVLAMGSAEQVANLQRVKQDPDNSAVVQRPMHSLDRQDLLSGPTLNGPQLQTDSAVEHVFELVIEGISGLKLFDNMMWGETDCFIQYHFPAQSRKKPLSDVQHMAPTMKCHRTATTLCTPDPVFHDCTRHKIVLPDGTPVQRELLTACANSGGGSGGLPFEVWCRYYHPNIREQVIAKTLLPLAKLCAMVTMQKRGEPSVQSFSLPLSHVAMETEEDHAEALAKVKESGLLDVTVNYKTQTRKRDTEQAGRSVSLGGSQICISVGVIRATGLKFAAEKLARLDPGMQYASEVGVNAYVRIRISFLSNEGERITKTVARTFSPEFSHYLDFPCPLIWTDTQRDGTSLAELLETGEATFEIWHQVPGLLAGTLGQYVPTGSEEVSGRCLVQKTGDVLLGAASVKLSSLLLHRTGVLGWYPLTVPSVGWCKDDDPDCTEEVGHSGLQRIGGGLELSLKFAHQEDREKVVTSARSLGWSALDQEIEDEGWISEDEEKPGRCHQISLSIRDVCFPQHNALLIGQNEMDKTAKCYVRYKFYDKVAVSTKLGSLHGGESECVKASFRHKHTFVFPRSSPLHWYLREERLEMQVWVAYGSAKGEEKRPRRRDKLIGSAYVPLCLLADTRKKEKRISGVYPVFKPGAASLGGACIHMAITGKLLTQDGTQATDDEDVVEYDHSDEEVATDDSFHHLLSGLQKVKDKFATSPENRGPSFGAHVFIERAMHLPLVSEKNKCGECQPSSYVSYQTSDKPSPVCTSIIPQTCNPTWDHDGHTHLSTELLQQANKNLVLKVWHKPSDAAKQPDKSSDRVLGFVSVDLSPLASGLRQICGWYNILDFNGQCKGQIKVSIVPDEPLGQSPQADGIDTQTSIVSQIGSFAVGSWGPRSLPLIQEQEAGVRHPHLILQQQQQQRLHSELTPEHGPTSLPVTLHWKPRFPDFSGAATEASSSKSYLFSSLRKQLSDLDSITAKLKEKLGADSVGEVSMSRSGAFLSGTHSGLSTINTVSSEGEHPNTSESAMASRSSNMVADSGAYSVDNLSQNTQQSSQQCEKGNNFVSPRDGETGSDSGVNRDTSPTGRDLSLSNESDMPQVLMNSARDYTNNYNSGSAVANGETSQDFLLNIETPRDPLSNYETSQGFVPGQMLPSQTLNTVYSSKKHEFEKDIMDCVHENSSDNEDEEKFGSYHHYRDMLDNEEEADDEEEEGVEVLLPRRINDVSGMLAQYYSGNLKDSPVVVNSNQSRFHDSERFPHEGDTSRDDQDDVEHGPLEVDASDQDEGELNHLPEVAEETGARPHAMVDSWLSETGDDEANRTPCKTSHAEDVDEATPRKERPHVSDVSEPTLLSNVEFMDTLTSTIEAKNSLQQDTYLNRCAGGDKNMLSNVDLDSMTSGNTSHRPDSGSSKVSGRSSGLSSQKKDDDGLDIAEGIEEDVHWPDEYETQRHAKSHELDEFFEEHQKCEDTIESTLSTDRSDYATFKRLSLLTDPHKLEHTINYVHGYESARTELHSDRTTEDSGLESGTKSSQDEKDNISMFEGARPDVPNFFLPPENLQASMRALQAATEAAMQIKNSDASKDSHRTDEKARAASELVKKLATRSKFTSVSAKSRQLPTADEAKRIAKIFAAKFK